MVKLFIICSIWIHLVTRVDPLSIPFLSNIQDMISLATDMSDLVTGRHDLTAGNLFKKKTDATLTAVNQLSEQISELSQTLNVKVDKLMNAVLTNVPKSIQFANLMRKLIEYVTRIDELFEDYQDYVNQDSNFTWYTMEDFARVTTSHKFGGVRDILRQIYHLYVPGQLDQRDESLLDVMVASLTNVEIEERCNKLKSTQQQVYDLYETVIITEIKGFIMTSYSYGLLSIYQNISFTSEMDKVLTQTIVRCSQYLESVTKAIRGLPRDIFLCDPPEHIKGETYVQINAIQTVIVSESMVSDTDQCSTSCPDLETRIYQRDFKYRGNSKSLDWKPASPCEGLLYNCANIDDTDICELSADKEERYSWVHSDGLGIFGEKDSCSNGTFIQLIDYSTNWYRCSVCWCQCSAENGVAKEDRTVSLRPQMADIDNNMIVTGVRFELKDKIIHVQIEQGKLLPGGQIEKNSIHLVELGNFTYLTDVSGGGFTMQDGDSTVTLEESIDYAFIRYRYRDVNLDIIYVQEPDYVVTGLKMSVDPEISRSIQLDVHVTPFDFNSGLLTPTDDKPSKWISYQDMPDHDKAYDEREWVDLKTAKFSPFKFYDNLPTEHDFAVTWFQHTYGYEEIGHNTVPFFDRQLVAPYPRVPLTGVSLYLRINDGDSGGFFAFNLLTYDISRYLNPIMTPENVELFKNKCEDKTMNNFVELE